MTRSIHVVGAGISGLAVAFELQSRAARSESPVEVHCFDAADRAGGNIQSSHEAGFICEWGPTGFLNNVPATLTLARRLGLADRMVEARPEAKRRFIYRGDRLRPVPTGAWSFLRSGMLGPWGKLRLLMEPLSSARRDEGDESIRAFGERRIGRAATSVMIDAMVSGIFAGDIDSLSVVATFPRMREMEREHGSLFRAMLSRQHRSSDSDDEGDRPKGGPSGPAGTLTSFRGGLQELTDALAAELGDRLHLQRRVEGVSSLGRRGFRLLPSEGPPIDTDAVVLACPSWHAAGMLEPLDADLSESVGAIDAAPLAVVHFGYDDGALGELPEGFGFLAPRGEGLRILGSLWPSCFFEGRAPENRRLMTSMIGGAHDRHAADLPDDRLIEIVREDLQKALGIHARPYFSRVFRHTRGIPQYHVGHPERLARIDARLADYPGLAVAGFCYRGIAVNHCIDEAREIADRLLEHLADRDAQEADAHRAGEEA